MIIYKYVLEVNDQVQEVPDGTVTRLTTVADVFAGIPGIRP